MPIPFPSRERIDFLTDFGSFLPAEASADSSFDFGRAAMDDKAVWICAINPAKQPLDELASFVSMTRFLEKILSEPAPLILLMDLPASHDSAQKSHIPTSPDHLLADRYGVGAWYYFLSRLSGRVPMACAVFNRLGATLTFPVSLCDVAVMTTASGMSIGRMDIVSKMTRAPVSYDKLGSAKMHAVQSGSIDAVFDSEEEVLDYIKNYIRYMPTSSGLPLPALNTHPPCGPSVSALIPSSATQPLDMDHLIETLVDDGTILELRQDFARETITSLVLFDGHPTAIIANRSMEKGGLFFPQSSEKVVRFIALCDAFGIPLVFLSDSAGFMVGSGVEQFGSIKNGARLMQAIATATTARLCVIVRRAYTAGLYAMSGAGMHPDRFIALPTAIMTIYGESVAMQLLSGRNETEKKSAEHMWQNAHAPQNFLDHGMLDAIVHADQLREEIITFISEHQRGERASAKPIPPS